MAKNSKILFLTLRTFSGVGGIEKVSMIVGKTLYELSDQSGEGLRVYSMYDQQKDIDEKYFPTDVFLGFGRKKISFVRESVSQGKKSDIVFLSHINLILIGFFIKLVSPKTKLVLFVHGIEVWLTFSWLRRKMLMSCDRILPVSTFTRDTMIELNALPAEKFVVLNNCLDPFLLPPVNAEKSRTLLNRYRLSNTDIILMALTRLSAKEKYKGYDKVLYSMPVLIKEYPALKYLIVGKYDDIEKERLDEMIKVLGLQNAIIFAGFVPDEELADHFNLADMYVMPSEKEGFGIVFIEAMYYGKPVIAGNKDGSVDALKNGELGLLVNPDDQNELIESIKKIIHNKKLFLPDQEILMKNFSYLIYKKNLSLIMNNLVN